MSGQAASLSLSEARKMQIAVQHPSSHAHGNGGKKSTAPPDHNTKAPNHQSK